MKTKTSRLTLSSHALNAGVIHDFHSDAADFHHGHLDDAEHEEDESHGHHGEFSHGHDHDRAKDADHSHYEDSLGRDDHLIAHNHPDHHPHHGHKGNLAHHHGEETTSFFLNPETVDYLNSLETKVLRLKVEATVYDDPAHHHHVKAHNGSAGDVGGEDGEGDGHGDEGEDGEIVNFAGIQRMVFLVVVDTLARLS